MKNLLKDSRGMALVVVIFVSAVLLSLTAAGLLFSGLNLKMSGNQKTRTGVFYIAEAGVSHAWQELANGDGTNDFATVFNAAGTTTLFSNTSFGSGSYTVTAQPIAGSNPNRVKVNSIGCMPAGNPCPSGNSKAAIEAEFTTGQSLFRYALFGVGSTILKGGKTSATIVDSYDSRVAPYNPSAPGGDGDAGGNGNIDISGNTTVRGDAAAGGSVVISGGSSVTGTVTNGAPSQSFPSVNACGPPYSNGSGITGGSYDPATGVLTVSGGGTATLTNGTYCFSSVNISGGATLTVNGAVNIYLTNVSSFSGGSLVNTTADAANLTIYSSFASAGGPSGVELSGGSDAYMTVYAPSTRVTLSGTSDFYGSIVANIVEVSGGSKLHYDVKLGATGGGGGSGSVKLASLKELF